MYRRRCDCELRIQRTDHCLMCVCVWWETHATCACSAMLIPRKCNNSHAPFVTEAVRVHFPELLTGTETKMNDVCWLQRLQQAQHQPTKQQQKNRHQNVDSWIGAHFQMLQLWYFTRWRMPLSQPPSSVQHTLAICWLRDKKPVTKRRLRIINFESIEHIIQATATKTCLLARRN